MNMRTTVLVAALLSSAFLLPTASAADPLRPLPPLVGVCVDDVTHSGCYRFSWICIMISDMVPQCIPHQNANLACGDICDLPVEQTFSGPEPMCMYYYYELDLGAVRYVQRDSCHSELYVLGEQVK